MINFSYLNTEGTQLRLTWSAVFDAVQYRISRRKIDVEDDFTVLDDPNNPTSNLYFEDYGEFISEGCNAGDFGLLNGIYVYKVEALNSSGTVINTDYTRKIAISTMIRVGYFFGNFQSDTIILTPDDIRYTIFWGQDLVASNEDEFTDEQIRYRIKLATADWEKWLRFDITKKILKCDPDSSLIKGVQYDEEVDPFPFKAMEWMNRGFVSLRRCPVISIEQALLLSPTGEAVQDITTWARLEKKIGIVYFWPKMDSVFESQGVLAHNLLGAWGRGLDDYPEGFKIDFTVGHSSMAHIPEELRGIVAKWAGVYLLDEIGDGILSGFSAASNSIDGLSQSFSSTQSATSAYYGARIKSYIDEMKMFWDRNRMAYNVPMSCI